MTIHYSITPNEVTKSFFRQLRYSPAFRLRLFLYGFLFAFIYLLPHLLRQNLRIFDIVIAFLIVGGFFLLLPFVVRFLTKPQQRTLAIGEEGIQTSIGSRTGTIAWSQIANVVDDNDYLFIIGQNGNSFLIPRRAFTTPAQRQDFLQTIKQYRLSSSR